MKIIILFAKFCLEKRKKRIIRDPILSKEISPCEFQGLEKANIFGAQFNTVQQLKEQLKQTQKAHTLTSEYVPAFPHERLNDRSSIEVVHSEQTRPSETRASNLLFTSPLWSIAGPQATATATATPHSYLIGDESLLASVTDAR